MIRRLWVRVSAIKVTPSNAPVRGENGREYLLEEESQSELSVIIIDKRLEQHPARWTHTCAALIVHYTTHSHRVHNTCVRSACAVMLTMRAFHAQIMQKAAEIQEAISEGAVSFLMTEYKYMAVFMVRSDTG